MSGAGATASPLSSIVRFDTLRKLLLEIASALEDQTGIPSIAQQAVLIEDIQTDQWWEGVSAERRRMIIATDVGEFPAPVISRLPTANVNSVRMVTLIGAPIGARFSGAITSKCQARPASSARVTVEQYTEGESDKSDLGGVLQTIGCS